MTKEQRIIEKQDELIRAYENQPDVSDGEDIYYHWEKYIRELDKELSALKSEDSEKYDKDTCCVCHRNYVDSSSGFDT